jgi:hypothetical protein
VTSLRHLPQCFFLVLLPCLKIRRHGGRRALDDIGDKLHVQSHVQAVCAGGSAGVVDGVNDHAKDRECRASMLAVGGLTSAVTASMVEDAVCAFLSTARTLVSTSFAAFTVSPRSGGKGMLHAVNECTQV